MVHVRFKYQGETIYEKEMKLQALPRLGETVTVPGSQKKYTVQLIHRKYLKSGVVPIGLVTIELTRGAS